MACHTCKCQIIICLQDVRVAFSDLVMLHEGELFIVNDIVDVEKLRVLHAILNDFLKYQQPVAPCTIDPELMYLLQHPTFGVVLLEDEKFVDMSFTIEPRLKNK